MFKFIIKYILSRQSKLTFSRTAFIEDLDSYGLNIPGDKFLFKQQDNLKFNRNNFKSYSYYKYMFISTGGYIYSYRTSTLQRRIRISRKYSYYV